MISETVRYNHNGFVASVTVSESNGIIGTRRSRLRAVAVAEMRAAFSANGRELGDDTELNDEWLLRVLTYPNLIAPVTAIDIDGNTELPDFQRFSETLPEPFLIAWEEAVHRINAHWWGEHNEAEAKKEPTPST
jgi:hypothetical protein